MKKVISLALVALTSTAFAEPPARIDVSNLPSQSKMIDDVVVPVPSEIFGVLDKLGKPNWTAVQHKMTSVAQPIGEAPQIALMLGAVIAEGFIAVEAEDANEVKQIGKSVLNLAKALGVEKKAQVRAKAITDAAEAKDWVGVRKQLDKALDDVRDAMMELNSGALSHLVSLGGWLRGTNVVTAFISNSYSEDKAELLNQPGLIAHFREMIAAMAGPSAGSPAIRSIATGLARLEAIVADPAEISEEDVKQLRDISRLMLEEFYFKKAVAGAAALVKPTALP